MLIDNTIFFVLAFLLDFQHFTSGRSGVPLSTDRHKNGSREAEAEEPFVYTEVSTEGQQKNKDGEEKGRLRQ